MVSEIIRKVIGDTMVEMKVNPYGLTFYNTKRGVSVAFISAFGESVKECFEYAEGMDSLYDKASEMCLKFKAIDKPFE